MKLPISFPVNLSIELSIELLVLRVQSCVSSRVLGRPGPGPDRLGLKCYLAWGGTRVVVGGKGDDFMYLYHNFSLVNKKRMLWVFVHTNFSIRVFWERRDKKNIIQIARLMFYKF